MFNEAVSDQHSAVSQKLTADSPARNQLTHDNVSIQQAGVPGSSQILRITLIFPEALSIPPQEIEAV